MAEKSSAVK